MRRSTGSHRLKFEAPFVTVRPGQPYGVLVGEDIYADTLSNARAVFASANTCSDVVITPRIPVTWCRAIT